MSRSYRPRAPLLGNARPVCGSATNRHSRTRPGSVIGSSTNASTVATRWLAVICAAWCFLPSRHAASSGVPRMSPLTWVMVPVGIADYAGDHSGSLLWPVIRRIRFVFLPPMNVRTWNRCVARIRCQLPTCAQRRRRA